MLRSIRNNLLVALFLLPTTYGTVQKFVCSDGYVIFRSDAPLEVIIAQSNGLKGVIDQKENTFAFSIDMQSFEGFNSPLQRVHFNENYLESDRFRTASFSGKIIEAVNYDEAGTSEVRAKGTLDIHGVEKERIINGQLTVDQGIIEITSSFLVMLDDHNIKIPKIVNQKIAKEIKVEMKASLTMIDSN